MCIRDRIDIFRELPVEDLMTQVNEFLDGVWIEFEEGQSEEFYSLTLFGKLLIFKFIEA